MSPSRPIPFYGDFQLVGSDFEAAAVVDDAPLKTILQNTQQFLNPTVAFTNQSEVLCLATDLFILSKSHKPRMANPLQWPTYALNRNDVNTGEMM